MGKHGTLVEGGGGVVVVVGAAAAGLLLVDQDALVGGANPAACPIDCTG